MTGAALVGAGRAWAGGPAAGLRAALTVLVLGLASALLVRLVPADAVLAALPGRAGLAVVLMVQAVPTLVGTVEECRDAARARGAERSPRTWLTPAAVRAVGRAHRTGEALAARGLPDPRRRPAAAPSAPPGRQAPPPGTSVHA